MKKYLLLLLSFVVVLNSCQKAKWEGTVGDDSVADTYQPFTNNSYWTYHNGTTAQADSTRTTMTAGTAIFNSKTYHTVNSISNMYPGVEVSYFYTDNHVYSMRSTSLMYGVTVDMIYLNDALPVGATWTSSFTDSGLVNGVPAKTIGTVAEINITKTVLGKIYNNVIHTKIDLQYDYGSGFTSTAVYDFYVAKNIGVIEIDSTLNIFGISINATSLLSAYSIK